MKVVSKEVAIKEALVVMEPLLLCSLVILALKVHNNHLRDSSQSVAQLRLLELQWVMMAEPKDSLMLNSKVPKVPKKLLN